MAAIVLGADSSTLVLNGMIINDFAEGDTITMSPVNARTSRTHGNAGNVIVKERVDRNVYDITIRVIQYSRSDVWLNDQMNGDIVLFNGSLKETFIKDGNVGSESWSIENGSITTQPSSTKNNQDGQPVMEYTIQAVCERNV